MCVSGKRIIVTGAASGIGQQSAKILKERGATVIGFDRNKPRDYVDEYIKMDLMDPASIVAAVEEFKGGADALCNVAGLPPTAPVLNVVTVNFVALCYFTELMVDKLNDGASIVNMASLAGVGWPDSVTDISWFIENANFENVSALCEKLEVDQDRSYFFSKEALLLWTMKNWNIWRDRNIRVNAISPGPVETPILQDFLDTLGERAEEDMKIMGRAGTAEDIAKVVAFLCSDDSAWINGANIAADGGMNAHVMRQIHEF